MSAGSRRLAAPPRPLTWVAFRHTAIFVVAAMAAGILARGVPIETHATVWLLAALALGLLSALGGGWLGLIFLVFGLLIGAGLEFAARHGATEAAAGALQAAAPSYIATLIIAIAAYSLMRLLRRQFGP